MGWIGLVGWINLVRWVILVAVRLGYPNGRGQASGLGCIGLLDWVILGDMFGWS